MYHILNCIKIKKNAPLFKNKIKIRYTGIHVGLQWFYLNDSCLAFVELFMKLSFDFSFLFF